MAGRALLAGYHWYDVTQWDAWSQCSYIIMTSHNGCCIISLAVGINISRNTKPTGMLFPETYELIEAEWCIYASVNYIIISSDNGLLPGRHQAITWTNVGMLLIGLLATNFSEMIIEIHTFSFKKIHLKMSSGKWRPFCLGLNVLTEIRTWISIQTKVFVGCNYLSLC